MEKIFQWSKYVLCFSVLVIYGSCTADKKPKTPSEAIADVKVGERSRFMVPTRPGAYYPKGLRKLSVLEMKKLGENGFVNFDFVCKDEYGRVVSKDYYSQGSEPRFMQLYVNENDVVIEGVIMEMSDELKSVMAMMRFVQ